MAADAKQAPTVRLKPSSYQPTKAEMEKDVMVAATLDDLARAVTRTVDVEAAEADDQEDCDSSL